ncbi:RNA-binding domain-containing protein [Calocera cornea HHB12733]|uniref:RNA-binding domain-containing protein n=1 Tax=Calocera cornea HHB12733 TaxID=1353952 RepID=A0A165DJM0_9BASI|nr:RNA-binding domain-containing protein [Calocera cornea HHB12733]
MEGDLSLEQRIGDEPSTDHTMANMNGHDTDAEHKVPVDDSDTGRDGDSPTKGGFGGRWKAPREAKPNKVYIGGLPETTRQEDLQNCFGKLGNVVNIELKLGYGFVEFDNVTAAEEAVAKYNEGFFMGSKIKVELSHGGGRTSKECPTGGGPVRKTMELLPRHGTILAMMITVAIGSAIRLPLLETAATTMAARRLRLVRLVTSEILGMSDFRRLLLVIILLVTMPDRPRPGATTTITEGQTEGRLPHLCPHLRATKLVLTILSHLHTGLLQRLPIRLAFRTIRRLRLVLRLPIHMFLGLTNAVTLA